TEIVIEEIHHRNKKDKPSGTALLIKGKMEASQFKINQINSVRGGSVFGVHKIQFFSEGESVSIEHVALSRTIFARGALQAASWVAGQKAGLYSMKDVLDL